jgi:hypothetical protein
LSGPPTTQLLPVTGRSIASAAFGNLGSDASGFAVYFRSGSNVSAEVRIGEARTLEKAKTIGASTDFWSTASWDN